MRIKRFLIVILSLCLANSVLLADSFSASLSQKTVKQGSAMVMKIATDGPIKQGTIFLASKKFTIYDNPFRGGKQDYLSYLGVSRYTKPGTYKGVISILFPSGKRVKQRFTVKVVNAKFRESKITLTGKKKTLANNRKQLSNEGSIIGAALKTMTRKAYFSESFIWPTHGTFTTPFGAFRSYNGRHGSKHSGTDIANAIGTPVLATNTGKVVLSKSFRSHGNTILIDHGMGIVSIYNHLDSRAVREGQLVQKGQEIGKMGTTGISTGSHLHWGMSVQNIRVNPPDWVDNKLWLIH